MALKIENLIINEARTRIDADVTKTAVFGEDWKAHLRILCREPMPLDKEEDFLKQITERKKEWKQGKKNQVLSLTGINATGYILNYETIEEGIL
ncbi:hypothetical protein [Haliscomenobacter sp.]|uniref:hypothetical protein n=1 Tax=Haliscomenobacter sp. TaxID=2717303 RepID=UPI003BA85F3E